MPSTYSQLLSKGLLSQAPAFLETCVQYEVIMGSVAYGVSNDTSDMDVYGFAIPPRDMVFAHLRGEIPGFDEPEPEFTQFQQHHINDKDAMGGKGREYDITIYSIIKYFRMLMENNPNIIDSLFVPRNCILYSTQVGELVRENRGLFLHKGCWPKFKGYAYSQMHKMRTKQPIGGRKQMIEEFGFDVKFAYHVVRLLNEVEQILTEKTLVLDRNKEQLKAIRRGEWSLEKIQGYFEKKESELETLYINSDLPDVPDKERIKALLLNCLEQHYGSLDKIISIPGKENQALQEIKNIIDRFHALK